MQPDTASSDLSKTHLWTGRILSVLVVLFLLFDSIGKFIQPAQVTAACDRLGWPPNLIVVLGVILLICTVLYTIPRTSLLGATLLTGYLGGAVAINLRAGSPLFETVFPIIFGVLAWGGILLRDNRIRVFASRRT
jgi:uncharacterized membrane protein (UPF0182 family)